MRWLRKIKLIVVLGALLELSGQLFASIADAVFPEPALEKIFVPHPKFGWTFRGTRDQFSRGMPSHVVQFNDLGLRGRATPTQGAELMLLGDSVTAGLEVPEESTFSARLGAINAGFAGYSTYQQLEIYETELSRFRPKRLGLVICLNDLLSMEMDRELRFATVQGQSEDHQHWSKRLAIFRMRETLLRIFDPVVKDRYYLRMASREPNETIWSDLKSAILKLRNLHGRFFFMVLVPSRSQIVAFARERKAFAVNQRFRLLSREEGIPLLDLLEEFDIPAREKLFMDPVHLSADGHALTSKAIAQFLQSSLHPDRKISG